MRQEYVCGLFQVFIGIALAPLSGIYYGLENICTHTPKGAPKKGNLSRHTIHLQLPTCQMLADYSRSQPTCCEPQFYLTG